MSEMTPEKAKELRTPFPNSAVGRLPKGGAMLDFVGHAAVTDRLLAVDPSWTWEPLALDEHGLPAVDKAGNLWIKLTVCGVTRLGVGDGKSAKECIGDAIRNAAMRFGVALDLWSRQELSDSHEGPPLPAQQNQGPTLDDAVERLRKAAKKVNVTATNEYILAALTARGLDRSKTDDVLTLAQEWEAAA